MRFTAQDVKKLLDAFAVLADDDAHRHSRGFALDTVTDLGPRLVDAYCVAAGLELPVK